MLLKVGNWLSIKAANVYQSQSASNLAATPFATPASLLRSHQILSLRICPPARLVIHQELEGSSRLTKRSLHYDDALNCTFLFIIRHSLSFTTSLRLLRDYRINIRHLNDCHHIFFRRSCSRAVLIIDLGIGGGICVLDFPSPPSILLLLFLLFLLLLTPLPHSTPSPIFEFSNPSYNPTLFPLHPSLDCSFTPGHYTILSLSPT